jgi:maltose/moltooligosaccharide transporter
MTDTQAPRPVDMPNAPIYKFVVMCVIWSALIMTENVSNILLSITILDKFDLDADKLGYILAINPAFGFIAQPVVGILSDRIWTPLGRRAVFLIFGAPIVAACLFFVPVLTLLWHVVVVVVIYQFFQDVLWGSDHPLMADLFAPKQRVILAGFLAATGAFSGIIFLKVFMVYFDEVAIYRTVAGIQIVCVSGAAFFLGEKKHTHKPPRINPWIYIKDVFGDTYIRRFAVVNFSKMLHIQIILGYVSAFAIKTMGFTKAEFGANWGYQPIITLVVALPFAYIIEKYLPKQWTLVGAYFFVMIGAVFGFMAQTPEDLITVAILVGIGVVIDNVTLKPFSTEFLPREKIGQLTGALNIFLALGRTAALAGGGVIIALLDNNYRYIFIVSIVLGVLTSLVVATIPDLRFQERKRGRIQ